MKNFMLLSLLVLYSLSFATAQKEETRRLYIKDFTIYSKKANGKSWDILQGKADPVLKVYMFKEKAWKLLYTSKKFKNSLGSKKPINTKIDVPINSKIKFELIDKDIRKHDFVGSHTLNIDMLKIFSESKVNRIQFGRVKSLGYFFSKEKTYEMAQKDLIIEDKREDWRVHIEGIWKGYYLTKQTQTRVELKMKDGKLQGTFGLTYNNQMGSFHIEADIVKDGTITIKATKWIKEVKGFPLLILKGRFEHRTKIKGQVYFANQGNKVVGGFEIHKVK